nr:MAG TPA: hypothetical protein [Caudoviricetes sp.]DAJ18026.1 MAG TPA: hypothetical protein [Podoviridae sp. ctY3D12]DAL01667.1 MAG TPA: hypothetical protein [Caudoviricetes sp.]DAN87419.1 MAG TPA: hypothetical protein [Caudoviricetes sp.]
MKSKLPNLIDTNHKVTELGDLLLVLLLLCVHTIV